MCKTFNKNMGCWVIATANPQNLGGGKILIRLLTFLATSTEFPHRISPTKNTQEVACPVEDTSFMSYLPV